MSFYFDDITLPFLSSSHHVLQNKDIQSLLPYTNYSVTVAVYNDAMGDTAIGPFSNTVVTTTWEAGEE